MFEIVKSRFDDKNWLLELVDKAGFTMLFDMVEIWEHSDNVVFYFEYKVLAIISLSHIKNWEKINDKLERRF